MLRLLTFLTETFFWVGLVIAIVFIYTPTSFGNWVSFHNPYFYVPFYFWTIALFYFSIKKLS